MQAVAESLWLLFLGRAIAGFCVSIIAISVSLYNSEVAPSNIRGKIVGSQQIMVGFGATSAYWVNYFVGVYMDPNDDYNWRLPLFLQCVPAALLFLGMFFVPRSPRWLAQTGRWEEARKSLAIVRDEDEDSLAVEQELQIFREYLSSRQSSKWSDVFTRHNRKRLYVGVPLILFQQFAGQNLMNYFAPTVFRQLGLVSKSADLLATGFMGILKTLSTIPAVLFVDRFGRRPLFLIGCFGMLICMLYIGSYYHLRSNIPANDPSGYIAITLVYIFMAFYSMSWGPLHYVIPSEIYPQMVRAKSDSLSGAVDWAGQFASIKLAPLIMLLPGGSPFFLYGVLLAFFFGWGFVMIPETKGLRLEDMDVVFEDWRRWKTVRVEDGLKKV